MCGDRFTVVSDGQVTGVLVTTAKSAYGATGRDPQNTFTVRIDDARKVGSVSTISTSGNGTVRRSIEVTDRYVN